jgi:hypothetical protein
MKNKWIWITLSVILVLALIAGVGVLGYRVGLRSTNVLALQGDGSTPYPRQLMPGMRDGMIVRRPAGFIGYFFLFPLRLLLGLAVLLLVVWLIVKVAKAAWNGGDHKPKPAEAAVSPAATETVITEAPVSSSEPTSTPESDQK